MQEYHSKRNFTTKKETAKRSQVSIRLVGVNPGVDLSLCQTDDILSGVGGQFATVYIQEVQTFGGLEQNFLITSGIAKSTYEIFLD